MRKAFQIISIILESVLSLVALVIAAFNLRLLFTGEAAAYSSGVYGVIQCLLKILMCFVVFSLLVITCLMVKNRSTNLYYALICLSVFLTISMVMIGFIEFAEAGKQPLYYIIPCFAFPLVLDLCLSVAFPLKNAEPNKGRE